MSQVGAVCVLALAGAGAPADDLIDAVVVPSRDVTLSFVQPGQIAEVLVEPGDRVEVGQLLIRQDDAPEQARLAHLKAQAEDDIRVKAAEARLAQSRVDLAKLTEARTRGAATDREVEHAELDVTIAEMSLALARFERAQAGRSYQQAKLEVARRRLRSSTAGIVERVSVEQGEAVNALDPVLRIVRIDPLWVDVPVPLARAARLDVGDAAVVTFPDVAEAPAGRSASAPARAEGIIIHVSSVGDAASETLMVRVEIANHQRRPAGQPVTVTFVDRDAVDEE
ncbi:MAG: efflux RND transporter periplasmic adaptor subunit [Phycisphaerae bacterium]|nr:efflux RND transporter periplasmic adaptor subunit [Phycisphaerae bacterium]